MSGTAAQRDWKNLFAPPPPPPLAGRSPATQAPSMGASTEPEPELEDGGASAEAPDRAETLEPQRHESAGSPRREEVRAPAVRADRPRLEAVSIDQPTTSAEKAQAAQLVETLEDLGVAGEVVRMDRDAPEPTYLVRIADPDMRGLVMASAEALADAMNTDEVVVSGGPDRATIRVGLQERSQKAGPSKSVAVYVPVEVRDRVHEELARTEESFTTYFLGAFNRQYEQLPALFRHRLKTTGPMPTSRVKKYRRGIATAVQMWLTLDPAQREVLEEAAEQFAAGNRSALVTKIVETDLGLPTPRNL